MTSLQRTLTVLGLICLTAVWVVGCGDSAADTKVTYRGADEGLSVAPPTTNGGNDTPSNSEDEDVPTEGFGTLTGRVVYTGGTPPTLAPLYGQGAEIKDAAVCSAEAIPNEKLVVKEVDGKYGVANTFVYLRKAPKYVKDIPAAPSEPLVFDQKGCVFKPHCLIVQKGRTVQIKNSDATNHNTHTFASFNDNLNSSIPEGAAPLNHSYSSVEQAPFQVTCDFHKWMISYHMVIDHPWGAVTDEAGNFTIPNFPAGKHDLRIWHESAKDGFVLRKFTVIVKKDEETVVEIPYNAEALSSLAAAPVSKRVSIASLAKP